MSKELEKKSQELEQTLAKQLDMLKKDSQDWLKVGAAVAAGALLTYGIAQAIKKKKSSDETQKAMAVLEKEGLLNKDLKKRLTQNSKPRIWPSLAQRLLILGFALAKDQLINGFFTPSTSEKEVEETK